MRTAARAILLSASLAVLAAGVAGCSRRAPAERLEWTSMGTVAAVQLRGETATAEAPRVRDAVQGVFRRVEGEFSRFDANSVLRRTGRVSAFGEPCAAAARALCAASKGAFNPFWRGADEPADYGAIAKGFAVDLAAEAVAALDDVKADVLIDLGGNLKAVRGTWRTGVLDPRDGGVAETLELRADEALATSAECFRGKHICDGRTGRPVSNDVASVTVKCPSALWADGLSTTLFVLGQEEGRRFLETGLPAEAPRPTSAHWIPARPRP